MARTTTLASVEAEIKKIEDKLKKLKEEEDSLNEKLAALNEQREKFLSQQVMDAFKESGMEMSELMEILKSKKASN